MSSTPYALVGKAVRVTLYARAPGGHLVPLFKEGRVSDVALGVNVAPEGAPERLLDLAVVTGLEGYRDGEAVVPIHDIEVLDDAAPLDRFRAN